MGSNTVRTVKKNRAVREFRLSPHLLQLIQRTVRFLSDVLFLYGHISESWKKLETFACKDIR